MFHVDESPMWRILFLFLSGREEEGALERDTDRQGASSAAAESQRSLAPLSDS